MIDHVWSVICRRAIVDQGTNLLSLIDSIESMNVAALSGQASEELVNLPIELEIVTLWVRSNPEVAAFATYRVKVELPNGDMHDLGAESKVDLMSYQRLRSRLALIGVPFGGPGRHKFHVQLRQEDDWKNVGWVPIDFEELSVGAPSPVV